MKNWKRGHHEHRPYWKRAHHDWRFWVALVLMLAAMLIYVMTDDLSIAPHIRARPDQTGKAETSGAIGTYDWTILNASSGETHASSVENASVR